MRDDAQIAQITDVLQHKLTQNTGVLQLPSSIGEGKITMITISETLQVVISDVMLFQDLTTQFHNDSEMVELNFVLNGHVICSINQEPFRLQSTDYAISYFHHSNVQIKNKANERLQRVEIRMTPNQLLSYFKTTETKAQIATFLRQQLGQIILEPFTPTIKQRVYEILHCVYEEPFKSIYIEAKVMELIVAFFAKQQPKVAMPNVKDAEKLHEVKAILLQELEQTHTLQSLAERVQITESKLKIGFKQLFGETVFTFIRRQRMEQAAWLLEVEGCTVTEVAVQLGYSNMSNFTVAFRKHFGCNPSEYLT